MSKRRYLTGKEVQAMMQAVCYGATGARDYCLILLAYRHGMRISELLDLHYRHEGYQRIDARDPGGLSRQLDAYFAGDLSVIETLPTATAGTPFQREVWQALRTIPCGQVMHYGQLAETLGRPGAARAVGAANGSNPVSIVVPCHRVIGRNGTMTGYAGGVQRKEWLLRHEGYLLL